MAWNHFCPQTVSRLMSLLLNNRLLHMLQGNAHVAQAIMCRFRENYPVLLQLFLQAWRRGDVAAINATGARIASHLRVTGMAQELDALQRLLELDPAGTDLLEEGDWARIQFAID